MLYTDSIDKSWRLVVSTTCMRAAWSTSLMFQREKPWSQHSHRAAELFLARKTCPPHTSQTRTSDNGQCTHHQLHIHFFLAQKCGKSAFLCKLPWRLDVTLDKNWVSRCGSICSTNKWKRPGNKPRAQIERLQIKKMSKLLHACATRKKSAFDSDNSWLG